MPWEDSAHGRLKHLLNAQMGTMATSLNLYIQEIAGGERSGRHRHFAEEAFFVIEGAGYDLHWNTEYELRDRYERVVSGTPQRYDWRAGDLVVVPSDVVHQHVNPGTSRARILSMQSRLYECLGYGEVEQIELA
jgi:quercetin dioxygenase-like cupin family protein